MPTTVAMAGARTRPVRIEQRSPVDTTDASGFPQEVWTVLAAEVFMRRTDGAGARSREHFVAQEFSAPMETRWDLGYRADMDPDKLDVARLRRLVYSGRIFDIQQAAVVGQWEGLTLLTLARQG